MPNILSFAIKLRYELLIRTGTTAQDAGMTAQNEWNTHVHRIWQSGAVVALATQALMAVPHPRTLRIIAGSLLSALLSDIACMIACMIGYRASS